MISTLLVCVCWRTPGPAAAAVPARGGDRLHALQPGRVKAEADFLRDVADGVYDLVPVTSSEAARAADLVERYADLPLGTADAFVVAVAEKFRAVNVATLDRRHFSIVRPAHVPAFTLLP